MEEEFSDKFNNRIKFTDKRWNHIIKEHPEIGAYKDKLPDALKNPDLVKRSKRDKDTFLYYRYYKSIFKGKYLIVVARTKNNPVILTCYVTDRIKKGDLIWKKN